MEGKEGWFERMAVLPTSSASIEFSTTISQRAERKTQLVVFLGANLLD